MKKVLIVFLLTFGTFICNASTGEFSSNSAISVETGESNVVYQKVSTDQAYYQVSFDRDRCFITFCVILADGSIVCGEPQEIDCPQK
jgi:hypothetical protein